MKKQMMVRLTEEIYYKLLQKKAEMSAEYKANYTFSEVIEVLLLEAKCYEHK